MLAAHGIIVPHETVQQWAGKFGRSYASRIQRRRDHLPADLFRTVRTRAFEIWADVTSAELAA